MEVMLEIQVLQFHLELQTQVGELEEIQQEQILTQVEVLEVQVL